MTHPSHPVIPLPWDVITSVFLDMDGTLLDLHFDNVFFRETVPQAHAEKKGIPFAQAKAEILAIYKSFEGTLAWYDLNHWSRILEMDIPRLKERVEHLIGIHPHVVPFLNRLKQQHRPISLVTNAHPHAIALKFKKTGLGAWIQTIHCSHDIGHPKETPDFWHALKQSSRFHPDETLLADDTEAVLDTARAQGIAFPVHMAAPSSRQPPHFSQRFPSIIDFREIMPP
ncbi:MAG: GMP/IMP nucleotidase [Magnetococcales bacterium]|nr:GMP/IMP nucleotidase [Magnetococcales bacterium]MBF0150460.1 GMP/IMP nucleotidase [Magnetococcales bacterium]MBF0174699.1 GMP/IMP nucleotidase [Magnetococcales bacterium]MBF0348148.1 GMP/IMP nucleotidase [Magnetococcales bacterium]MBF0629468.1 GMP/IMP nucleotidase [Magnetococcales bacterium]